MPEELEEILELDRELAAAQEAVPEGQISEEAIKGFRARHGELLASLGPLAVLLKKSHDTFNIRDYRDLLDDFKPGEDPQLWLQPIEKVQAQIVALFESIIAEYGEDYIKMVSEDGRLSGEIISRIVGKYDGDADKDFAGIVRAELASQVSNLVRLHFWMIQNDLPENYHPVDQYKALPGFEIAARKIEAEVATKLQTSIVPAVASLNNHRIASAVSAAAIGAPINFWLISTWFNEGARLGFGPSFLIFILGNMLGLTIPAALAHSGAETFNEEMDRNSVLNRGGVAETGILSSDKFGHNAHGKRLMSLAGKAPQAFLDALAENVGGKVNYLRIATLLLVLGVALPYPLDKLVTEPAEKDVSERVFGTPEKAAKEFAAKLPTLSVDEVRKELSAWGSKPLTIDYSGVQMGSDFIFPGDDCEVSPFGHGTEEHSVSYSKILNAWVSKDLDANGVAKTYNIVLPTSDEWDLSDSEAEKCFHTNDPDFGARIVVDRRPNGEWAIKSFSYVAIQGENGGLKVTPIQGSQTSGSFKSGSLAEITAFVKALNQDEPVPDKSEKKVKKKTKRKRK